MSSLERRQMALEDRRSRAIQPKIYCGAKRPAPNGRPIGSPFVCFKKGIAVGRIVAEKTVLPQRLKQRTAQVEAMTSVLTKRQIAEQIHTSGIAPLKRELRLSQLNKDLIRSICVKYTGTQLAIPRYSSMSLDQLRHELVARGWKM